MTINTFESQKSDIADIIINRSKKIIDYFNLSYTDLMKFKEKFPLFIIDHPLMENYNWVYANVEFLYGFPNEYSIYQRSPKAYYTFFQAITNKYSMESDYNNLLNGSISENLIQKKWKKFAIKLVEFLSFAPTNDILDYLFSKDGVIEYFITHSQIYDPELMFMFIKSGYGNLLNIEYYKDYYCKHPELILSYLKDNYEINLPEHFFLDERFIASVSRNPNVLEFYYHLKIISNFVGEQPFIDEHKRFCEKEISGITDGILPSLIPFREELFTFNIIHGQIIKRLIEKNAGKKNKFTKQEFFKELTKYRVVGMFISYHFEAEPYDLLIDIETIYAFACKHNMNLRAQHIYEFLMNFEDYSLEELINIFKSMKDVPLKDILYDDWNDMKEYMINEINNS